MLAIQKVLGLFCFVLFLEFNCQGTEISARWSENCKHWIATTECGLLRQKLRRYKDPDRTVLAVWQRACDTAFTISTHKHTKINQARLAREQAQQGRGETTSHRQRCFCADYLNLSSKRVTFSMSSVSSSPLCYTAMERDIFCVDFHTDQ